MSNNRIQKLSPLLINQIAAGEVVTRPASVVKELIENAIDANANYIRIDIQQGGLGVIQISDNGEGIHPDDMLLAVTRHATSKLADVGELTGIDSLGFRGEALASIAAVSHLTLTSSHNDTGIGQQLTLSGDALSSTAENQVNIRPIVKNRGTTVTVRDLYYNVPARRSHLKSIATEFAHIEQVVQRLAISFANVQIELYHHDKLRLSLAKQSQNLPATQTEHQQSTLLFKHQTTYPLSRLEQALNQNLEAIAEPFFLSLQGLQQNLPNNHDIASSVTGWLFVDQRANLPKLIYINQRLVTDLVISQALQKVARQLGVGQTHELQFGYALFFVLPNDWININIHPSKQQVKIQPLTNILAWLSQRIYEQLQPIVAKKNELIQNAISIDLQDTSFTNHLVTAEKSQRSSHWQVNESQIGYINDTNKQTNDIELHANTVTQITPETTYTYQVAVTVLSVIEQDGQSFALIFWQSNIYLLDLAVNDLQHYDKFSLQKKLLTTNIKALVANANYLTDFELAQLIQAQKIRP